MPEDNNNQCQDLINLCALSAQQLKAIATQLEAYRQAYQDLNVDPTGTPLDGNVALVNNWINDVRAVANSAVAEGMIDHYVPSHRNKALGV